MKFKAIKETENKNTSSEKNESSNLSNNGNVINFYSHINSDTCLQLIDNIRETSLNCLKIQNEFNLYEPPPIHLHINSHGGYVNDGLGAMEIIRNNKVPIYTYIDGAAMSAATFFTVVGKKRFMYEESIVLIHQISGACWGNYEQQIDDIKNSKMLMDKIINLYLKYTKIEQKFLKDLLKRDLFLDSKTCLKYGLVDEIIGENK